jgi:hypothetical protein
MRQDISVAFCRLYGGGGASRVYNLIPFGDIHYDSAACARGEFRKFLAAAAKLENPYYIGIGDYLDFASSSERKVLRRGELHEGTLERLDRMAMADLEDFAGVCRQMRGRTVGLIAGNHDWTFADGTSGTDRLAKILGGESWGYVAGLQLSLQKNQKGHGTSFSVPAVFCHGKAGGKLIGTSINQVDRLAEIFPGCLIYGMGHDHQRGGFPTSALRIGANHGVPKLVDFEYWLVRCGSFLRSYQAGAESYAARRLLRPSSLGGVSIEMTITHRGASKITDTLRIRVVPL